MNKLLYIFVIKSRFIVNAVILLKVLTLMLVREKQKFDSHY